MKLAAAAALLCAAGPAQAQQRLTLREALDTALGHGREIAVAREGVAATDARVKAAGAQRFPSLKVDANVQYWDRPLVVAFVIPGMMPTEPVPALVVRNRTTAAATVTLAQPISGLLVLNKLIGLERNGREAARADQARARLDTAQRVAEAYLRLLQADALRLVAAKSVTQVEAQLGQAQILERGGVLGRVDVLRLSSARDNARAGQLRADTGARVAAAALALAMDLPPSTALQAVDDLPDPPPTPTLAEEEAVRAALRDRPEVTAASERAQQAQAGRGVALSALLPNILAIGSYQHTEGQSTFQPKNAYFVGGTLSWDVWDWGKNWGGVKEAEHKAAQAVIGQDMLRDQIAFDVQRRLLETRTAFQTLAVARTAQEAAEEAHRIQSVRYAAGAATTTDVLDAETDVTRARSGYAQARYDYYLSQAGLARALGQLPSPRNGGTR
jgi:outer membrane protein